SPTRPVRVAYLAKGPGGELALPGLSREGVSSFCFSARRPILLENTGTSPRSTFWTVSDSARRRPRHPTGAGGAWFMAHVPSVPGRLHLPAEILAFGKATAPLTSCIFFAPAKRRPTSMAPPTVLDVIRGEAAREDLTPDSPPCLHSDMVSA